VITAVRVTTPDKYELARVIDDAPSSLNRQLLASRGVPWRGGLSKPIRRNSRKSSNAFTVMSATGARSQAL
jgi:hypothetical protein